MNLKGLNWIDELRGYRYWEEDELEHFRKNWRLNPGEVTYWDKNRDRLLLYYITSGLRLWWFRLWRPKMRPNGWKVTQIVHGKWKKC